MKTELGICQLEKIKRKKLTFIASGLAVSAIGRNDIASIRGNCCWTTWNTLYIHRGQKNIQQSYNKTEARKKKGGIQTTSGISPEMSVLIRNKMSTSDFIRIKRIH